MHKRWFRGLSWLAVTILLTTSVALVEHNATVLRTSLIPSATHQPFDGTVYPVQKVPNWAQLTTEEYDNVYTMIPSGKLIDAPYYRASDFEVSFDTLTWGDPATEDLRNAKITYSVPYMGDYSLDAVEYSGSHLAVDIKVPKGTPVFSMANGVVMKVSNQTNGFGKHVVIEHKNFPTLEDDGEFTTYYSSYTHLDSILISEGEVVDKGDQIGLSGDTGTATTPHLHFQIDNNNADWHPYWPFTWQEANDAGLSFFSAVNAGLGQSRAIATTINPMGYVQKYLDPSADVVASAASSTVEEEVSEPEVVEPEVVEPEVVEPEVVEPAIVEPEVAEPVVVAEASSQKLEFSVVSRASYEADVTAYFTIYVEDENGASFEDYFDGLVNLSLNNEDVGELSQERLSADDFKGGSVKLSIKGLNPGKAKLKIAYGEDVFYSDWFEVVEPEEEEEPAEVISSFSDVPQDHSNYKSIKYLASNGVISGYSDGTFKPDEVVTRAEALKFILEGIDAGIEISDLSFNDVSGGDWFYKYVSTASLRAIVSGYDDGSFKPGNVVTRAEFMKILLTAIDANLPGSLNEDPFKDVAEDDWFAPYFQYAKDENIIDSGLRAWPMAGMKRSDVAEAMYRVMEN